MTLTLQTADVDLHSWLYGGIAPNSALEATKLLGKLYTQQHRIAIDNYYDSVAPISDEEMAADLQKMFVDPFDPDDEDDEDEPVVASVNLMVKIAQKLDSKKNYKLADKFTNILRKYNV